MPAEALAAAVPAAAQEARWTRRRAQVFRLAFGMTLASAVALGWPWPLSFITPVLAAKLLTLPKVMPFKGAIVFVGLLGGSFVLSATLLLPLLAYPAIHLLLTALILFLLFYAKASGKNPIVVVFSVVGVLMIPLIGTVSEALAIAVAWGLTYGAAVAVGMVYVAAAAFPDPDEGGRGAASSMSGAGPAGDGSGRRARATSVGDESAGNGGASSLPVGARAALAARSTLVVYPLAEAILLFSLVDLAVVLVMAALLALEPTFGKHLAAGRKLILTNLAGGLVAVVIYNLLVWVPSFTFFLLLLFLTGLWVGSWIFSDHPFGKLLGGGITTLFLILGPVVTGDAEAGSKLYLRVAMIMGAVVYVVLAFGLIERLTRGRRLAQS